MGKKISPAKSKNVCVKNVNQFINKPNEVSKSSNQSYLITPINKKYMGENNNKRFYINDNISLASISRIDIPKSFVLDRTMP